MCGGSGKSYGHLLRWDGLSPRVRGKRIGPGEAPVVAGSIPACAGEAGKAGVEVCRVRVYPRVCGGSAWAAMMIRGVQGLSPRVRGKRGFRRRGHNWGRSIPACAGEARRVAFGNVPLTVYPRVCGGSQPRIVVLPTPYGLSPRVRGKLRRVELHGAAAGSIPACAGEAAWPWYSSESGRVYPRVCGGSPKPFSTCS